MVRRGRTAHAGTRALGDLEGVGKATLGDLARLNVHDVETLAKQDARLLYDRLCELSGTRQDPCVLDVLSCAVAQAQDPDLPPARRKWWWWSRARKAAAATTGRSARPGR
jgi:hypothetical protein